MPLTHPCLSSNHHPRYTKHNCPAHLAVARIPKPARLNQGDAVGLKAFAAVDDIDAHALTRPQRLHAAAAQRRDMDKDVFSSPVRRDESIALVGLEPLHRSFERLSRTAHSTATAATAATAIEAAASTAIEA